jgi:putative tryptophan/tyrosine transport system substrate-binding protein
MQFDRLKRRELIKLIGGAAASGSVGSVVALPAAMAQQPRKMPRVGILSPAATDATLAFDGFRKGLRDLGYSEGNNIILDFRLAKGDVDALPRLAAELVGIPVDVIVTDGSAATRAAVDATRTIPIVIGASGDPVVMGFVTSIRRPGGNVTGMSARVEVLSGKRVSLLKLAVPAITSISTLMNPRSLAAASALSAAEDAAGALALRIHPLRVSTPDELRALSPADLAGTDALLVLAEPMFWNNRATVIALASAARLPAIYPERECADDGGLISYGPNIPDLFRRAAGYVDRILRGAKPGGASNRRAGHIRFRRESAHGARDGVRDVARLSLHRQRGH